MEAPIYNRDGKQAGTIVLPEQVFSVRWNNDLVHQVVTAMQANARTSIAHTKTRSEVSGTGKKPWKQKGTGQARHGSRRSPIWRTGGVAHGPRNEKDYTQKINKKMRVHALYAVLSRKVAKGEVLFVDSLATSAPATKEALHTLRSLASIDGFSGLVTKRNNATLIAGAALGTETKKSFQNFGNVLCKDIRTLNPVDVLTYRYLIIATPQDAVQQLAARQGGQEA